MGPILTIWSSAGISDAWARSVDFLRSNPLPQFELHSWPDSTDDERVVREAHALGSVVSFGVGMDGFAREVKRGTLILPTVKKVRRLYDRAHAMGAVEFDMDPEGWFKTKPATVERARIEDFIRALQLELAEGVAKTGLKVGLTTYDQPGLHASDYPWKPFLGRLEDPAIKPPITTFWPQVYAGVNGVMANTDSLDRREERSLASIAAMVRLNRIREDIPDTAPGGDPDTDLDVYPYFQGHHVPAISTVREALEGQHKHLKVWASPTRLDDQGKLAVRCLSWLWKHGFWGKSVLYVQKALNVTADGKFGPRSFSALLAEIG